MALASTVYLTGVSTPLTCEAGIAYENLGLLATPDSGVFAKIPHYRWWAADNGCFTKGDAFDVDRWLAFLERLATPERLTNCLFAVLPDVVGDAAATEIRSLPYVEPVRRMGYPAAYVAQNGLENRDVPWDELDCLFVGGSLECAECGWVCRTAGKPPPACILCSGPLFEWKLSEHAYRLAAEAQRRGKWTHMGRVNSWRRLSRANGAGYGSADGTYIQACPPTNAPKVLEWLDRLDLERPFNRVA